jgi:hypothetical protein
MGLGGFSPPGAGGQPAAGQPTREFAEGVRIDWERRVVEVDASVVLREGMLELLACSPQTREHESILVVKARPMHIYQAMGLIGLEPGSPVRYDASANRAYPPTGELLHVQIRYRERALERTVQARQWLREQKRNRPPQEIEWVFAGSAPRAGQEFPADVDGTVVCVVDFTSALIAVAGLHTADDEYLWLSANTEAIPPVGTPCTLLISSAKMRSARVTVEVTPDGALRLAGKTVAARDVLRLLHREEPGVANVIVALKPVGDVSDDVLDRAVAKLVEVGIGRGAIEVERDDRPTGGPPAREPPTRDD